MRFFLVPASNEAAQRNLTSTVANGVEMRVVKPHLDVQGQQRLGDKDKLPIWGVREAKRHIWDRMESGDIVLFYTGRDETKHEGHLTYAGTLVHKQQSKELGDILWPTPEGEKPWPFLFFMDDMRRIGLPVSVIAQHAGYAPGFFVQGFMQLSDLAVERILEQFGDAVNFLASYAKDSST